MKHYLVSADHVSPSFTFVKHPVRVSEYDMPDNSVLYYAVAAKLGCGRNYRSEQEAIRGLFLAHACTNIRIEDAV